MSEYNQCAHALCWDSEHSLTFTIHFEGKDCCVLLLSVFHVNRQNMVGAFWSISPNNILLSPMAVLFKHYFTVSPATLS